VALGVQVQRLRGDIGFVGPDNGSGVLIGPQPTEVVGVPQRLEYPSVLEQLGEVDPRGEPILEPDLNLMAARRSGFDQ
jgi:hypothetical protein